MKAYWYQFRTVAQWIVETAGSFNCKTFCNWCNKKWHEVEGDHVHLVDKPPGELSDCGMSHEFLCDGCFQEWRKVNRASLEGAAAPVISE